MHHHNHVLPIDMKSQPPVTFFPGYIYDFASSASKKLSESVAETAQNLKKSVEEGKINGIIDKVCIHGSVSGPCFPLSFIELNVLIIYFIIS